MIQEYLRHYPFLILSCVGLVIFVSVFLLQVARTVFISEKELSYLGDLVFDESIIRVDEKNSGRSM